MLPSLLFQVYFCILFAVFAMVNWSSIISVASGLLGGGGGGDAAADALHSASDPSSAQAVGDGFNGFGGEDDPDTICNHHNHRTGCFNT